MISCESSSHWSKRCNFKLRTTVKMGWPLYPNVLRTCYSTKLNKISAGLTTLNFRSISLQLSDSFHLHKLLSVWVHSTHSKTKPPPPVCECFLISLDEAPVCLLSIHLFTTHTTSCTRHRGKLGPRQFTVLSLLCSNVTISRNQSSSQSILNKYIFTVNLTSWFYTIPLQSVELLAIHFDMCISLCVCVQLPY